jgi:hypothetical protein
MKTHPLLNLKLSLCHEDAWGSGNIARQYDINGRVVPMFNYASHHEDVWISDGITRQSDISTCFRIYVLYLEGTSCVQCVLRESTVKVKVKLSLYLTKQHVMKTCGGWRNSPTHS